MKVELLEKSDGLVAQFSYYRQVGHIAFSLHFLSGDPREYDYSYTFNTASDVPDGKEPSHIPAEFTVTAWKGDGSDRPICRVRWTTETPEEEALLPIADVFSDSSKHGVDFIFIPVGPRTHFVYLTEGTPHEKKTNYDEQEHLKKAVEEAKPAEAPPAAG